METVRILIADDEEEARELILHYLDQSGMSYNAMQATDGQSTLQLLEKEKPDILFLDIKMPELNGIEVLQHREMSPLPAIIFTTAFDEFALSAFDFEATDYLLKPFGKERFDKAIERATRYVQFTKEARKGSYLQQLGIKMGSKTILVPVADIELFQADGAYIQVHTLDKNWLLSMPMYELESRLDPAHFLRVHKSVIIRIASVKSVTSLLNDYVLTLQSGKEVRGSRTYRTGLKRHFAL
jgi:two-component system, LytTR family, response regulator